MPLKPPRPSPTDSTSVAIPNAKTLTEYDAVALELAANIRDSLKPEASATSPARFQRLTTYEVA